MQFNSLLFVWFFLAVYAIYLLLLSSRHKLQNAALLAASYIFYGYWDWRFLSLILISTVVDFFAGRFIARSERDRTRRLLLGISITTNLSILGFFKYFNFFADSFAHVLASAGLPANYTALHIVLPVGISFYTFQTMSYTIDVYRGRLQPTRSLLDFALFVAFFPQLVAGPIERAVNLLPQIARPRRVRAEQVNAGLFLLLWGYYKKAVVADNLGVRADDIFNNYAQFGGIDLIIGMLAFTLQIYCDFSGYSDIARGLAKLMGFDLMVNFRLPYFALDPSDFWRRWHISLSSWLRDYLYIPLGGNRRGRFQTYRNLTLTMLLGGLWHGAAWNFLLWGGYHGTILSIHRFLQRRSRDAPHQGVEYLRLSLVARALGMFALTVIGWVIFRSHSVEQVFYMLTNAGPSLSAHSLSLAYDLLFFSAPLLIIQMYQQLTGDLLILTKLRYPFRVAVYGFILSWVFIYAVRESAQFIYFQF